MSIDLFLYCSFGAIFSVCYLYWLNQPLAIECVNIHLVKMIKYLDGNVTH